MEYVPNNIQWAGPLALLPLEVCRGYCPIPVGACLPLNLVHYRVRTERPVKAHLLQLPQLGKEEDLPGLEELWKP